MLSLILILKSYSLVGLVMREPFSCASIVFALDFIELT
ncbi:hypothetical protein LEP1GSC073_2007 [Leptospira noguchii str. Cascata]|nr:hypothetical protein LEP1GSC073_2007 [Leptospira noguchii str. Cascata]